MLGTLLGNYRVVEQLGQGGVGMVYVGRHEALGHRVVIKVLQAELCDDADMVQRFFNEARAATAVRSPGIVQVFDFGTTPDGRAYFVMELLEGVSLATRLRQRRCDHAECCRLGRQVANVLAAAHTAGITHRDLKPGNLFLVPDPEVHGGERVKVLDFGIAKLAGAARLGGATTRTGLVMGTPYYMSPEQCRSASVADARSDIYSLGCILFEISCGRPPFLHEGIGDVVAAHLHEPPPYPQGLAPDIPPGLSALIARMLSKHPDARPQTMSAVGQALDEILQGLGRIPTPFPPPAAPQRPDPSPPRPVPPPLDIGPAVPVPMPWYTSIATTIQRLTQPSDHQRNLRRLLLALGALVIVGAAAAIAFVLATAGPSERKVAYADIARATSASVSDGTAGTAPASANPVAPAPDAAAALAPTIAPKSAESPKPTEPPKPTESSKPAEPSKTAADVDAECQAAQAARSWAALGACADQLKSLDAKRADELATRATEEARSAPHVAAVRTALRDKNLKRAQAELAQVWPNSIDHAELKRAYDTAEAQEINALAIQLDSVKTADCVAYNQVLSRARTVNPPRVITEATRRSRCVPPSAPPPPPSPPSPSLSPPPCNADALTTKASAAYEAGKCAEALAAYEDAYKCRPSSDLRKGALISACCLRNLPKAKSYWKPLGPKWKQPAREACERHGITDVMLDAP